MRHPLAGFPIGTTTQESPADVTMFAPLGVTRLADASRVSDPVKRMYFAPLYTVPNDEIVFVPVMEMMLPPADPTVVVVADAIGDSTEDVPAPMAAASVWMSLYADVKPA